MSDGWFRWLNSKSDTIVMKPSGTTYENKTVPFKISRILSYKSGYHAPSNKRNTFSWLKRLEEQLLNKSVHESSSQP